MTTYEHICNKCQHEFELEYGMTEKPPTLCPECKIDGYVVRQISGGSGRGIVHLTGRDLQAYCKTEANRWKKDAMRDENVLANLVGETKYQTNTVQLEKNISDLPKTKIKRKKSA